jgi:CheY-like chemotaxis protein
MPNMTGFELAKKVVKIRPETPVILCTGFSEKEDIEELKAKGISALVLKPINKQEIAKTIRKVLDKGV